LLEIIDVFAVIIVARRPGVDPVPVLDTVAEIPCEEEAAAAAAAAAARCVGTREESVMRRKVAAARDIRQSCSLQRS